MAEISTLVDNFNDNSLNTSLWGVSETGDGSVSETNQTIVISSQTNDSSWGITGIETVNSYDLTSSVVSVKIDSIEGVDATDVWMCISADSYNLGANSFIFGYNSIDGRLAIVSYLNQAFDNYYSLGSYDFVNYKYLRIRESGGNLYFETSPDDSTWTTKQTIAYQWDVSSLTWLLFIQTPSPLSSSYDTVIDNVNYSEAASADETMTDTVSVSEVFENEYMANETESASVSVLDCVDSFTSQIGGGEIEYIGYKSAVSTTASVSVTYPSGTEVGDLVIATIQSDTPYSCTGGLTGWTVINNDSSGTPSVALAYKTVTNPSETLTFSGANGAYDPICQIAVFRGATWADYASTQYTGNGIPDPPSLGPGFSSGDWCVVIGNCDDDINAWSAPSGYTLAGNALGGFGEGSSAIAYRTDPSDTEDPGAFSTSNSDQYWAFTIALAPTADENACVIEVVEHVCLSDSVEVGGDTSADETYSNAVIITDSKTGVGVVSNFSESSVSDTFICAISATLTDSISTNDSSTVSASKTLSETVSDTDSTVAQLSGASLDTVTISDNYSLASGYSGINTDGVTVSDSYEQSLSQNLVLSDEVSTGGEVSASIEAQWSEDTTVSSSPIFTLYVDLFDSFEAYDTISISTEGSLGGSTTVGDSYSISAEKVLTDTVLTDDSWSYEVVAVDYTKEDGATASDSLSVVTNYVTQDEVPTSDVSVWSASDDTSNGSTVSDTVTGAASVSFSDTVSSDDTVVSDYGYLHIETSSTGVSDSILVDFSGSFSETISVDPAIGTPVGMEDSWYDAVGIGDYIVLNGNSGEETTSSVSDSLDYSVSVVFSETVFLSDQYSSAGAISDTSSDNSDISDNLLISIQSEESDEVPTVDSVVGGVSGAFSESISTSDSYTQSEGQDSTESASVSAQDTILKAISMVFMDSIGSGDGTTSSLGGEFSDSVSSEDEFTASLEGIFADAAEVYESSVGAVEWLFEESVGSSSVDVGYSEVLFADDSTINDLWEAPNGYFFSESIGVSDVLKSLRFGVQICSVTQNEYIPLTLAGSSAIPTSISVNNFVPVTITITSPLCPY